MDNDWLTDKWTETGRQTDRESGEHASRQAGRHRDRRLETKRENCTGYLAALPPQ